MFGEGAPTRFAAVLAATAAIALISNDQGTSDAVSFIQVVTDKNDRLDAKFGKYVAQFNKVIRNSADYDKKKLNFAKRDEMIQKSNNTPGLTYKLGHNMFSDFTEEEVNAMATGLQVPEQTRLELSKKVAERDTAKGKGGSKGRKPNGQTVDPVPTVDWIKNTTTVKNQGQCGSCYGFSSTGAAEAVISIKSGLPAVHLSEQQLVDCSSPSGNNGCNGGLMDNCYKYMMGTPLVSSNDYPYTSDTGTVGTCTVPTTPEYQAKVNSYKMVQSSCMAHIAQIQLSPIAIAVAVDAKFQSYVGGIYRASYSNINHAVIAVGMGTAADGTQFVVVENSWGTTWGEAGYIRIAVAHDTVGECGMWMYSVVPESLTVKQGGVEKTYTI